MRKSPAAVAVLLVIFAGGAAVTWFAGLALEDLPEPRGGASEAVVVSEAEPPAEVASLPPTRGRHARAPESAQEDAAEDAVKGFERLREARLELARRRAAQQRTPAPGAVRQNGGRGRVPQDGGGGDREGDGPFFEYYADGALKREGEILFGKRHGLWVDHYTDGSRTEVEYRQGKKYGQEASWSADGKPKFLGTWNDDVMYGTWTAWHANGVISARREYVNGKLSGRMQTFHANGALESESMFADGLDVATAYGWHDNGEPAWVMPYVDGERHGQARWYDRDGRLESEGTYVDGVLDGVWTKFRADGTVERTERWAKGVALGGR